MKSPAVFPPRKDPIKNQYITRIITQQYPKLPPNLSKVPTGNKPFIDNTKFSNPTENEHTDTTDNSCNDNKDNVDKINVEKQEDKDDEYKEDDPEPPKSEENIINKTEPEEEFTDSLMSMNSSIKVIQYLIVTISSGEKKTIELGKINKNIKQI